MQMPFAGSCCHFTKNMTKWQWRWPKSLLTALGVVSVRKTPSLAAAQCCNLRGLICFYIELGDDIINLVGEAHFLKLECSELGKQVDSLCQMLRRLLSLVDSTHSPYRHPAKKMLNDLGDTLFRTQSMISKCQYEPCCFFRCRSVFAILYKGDFPMISKSFNYLFSDMDWLLTIYEANGVNLNPPCPQIAKEQEILAWIWPCIATIQMGKSLDHRVDAAQKLACLALESDQNKELIMQAGGLIPLANMVMERGSADAQMAAATVLYNIANNMIRVRLILIYLHVPSLVLVLGDSPIRVQVIVAKLVSRMVEVNSTTQNDFAPLVSLLAKKSIEVLDDIEKEIESETPEMKLNLKVSCADALWKLSRGCLTNSRRIIETKGFLLYLVKNIENESGELHLNCFGIIMEVVALAESNADFRRVAFKAKSPDAKAVIDLLLKLIQVDDPTLQIPAIKSIGSLAHTFPARETGIIGDLVAHLGHRDIDVAIEAAGALVKFVSSENFNRVAYSKTTIEFDGHLLTMILLTMSEKSHMHGLKLLCHLASNVGDSQSLQQAPVLNTLQGEVARSVLVHHPDLKELFTKAIKNLNIYRAGAHQSFAP